MFTSPKTILNLNMHKFRRKNAILDGCSGAIRCISGFDVWIGYLKINNMSMWLENE